MPRRKAAAASGAPGPDPLARATYDGAPQALIDSWNSRRRTLGFARGEGLPPLDAHLKPLLAARVPEDETLGRRASAHAIKRHEIRRELVGFTELAALNALLIAHLRKESFPSHAPQLFRRIWTEEADALLAELPSRWLISSVITFGDHGETEAERRIGLAMNMLFSLMKLYEFERLYARIPADAAFSLRRRPHKDLPLDMPPFALLSGGLDVNLLAPIWQMAREEPLAGRIACRLLDRLNHEPRSLFRRIELMRTALRQKRAARSQEPADEPPGA